MNIAVRVPNWIGDCIMCLPAIGLIKKSIPESRITVVCRENLCDLFVNMKEIDDIIPIPNQAGPMDIWRTARGYTDRSFDRGVLFTNSFNSALWFRLMGIPSICGYKRDGRGFLLSTKIPYKKMKNTMLFIIWIWLLSVWIGLQKIMSIFV